MTTQVNEATQTANQETLLTPRFYTTDISALEKIDISPVQAEWDQMMSEFEGDNNVDHFVRDESFHEEVQPLDPHLEKEFVDFLISSVTSEYSGCVLYGKIAEQMENPEIRKLMEYMRRDEARHAGFINRTLKDFGVAVDLGFLKREKKETFFKPKYIYYATYLSEKIGYARYITIFRHLERNPEKRFHPIFRWFHRWCNDEFRHGEAFALIIRSQPELTRGYNRLWIRFFLLAVYATMYVRDHTRPEMFEAMGLDPTDYDFEVFRITTEISKQVFPITLATDAPHFRELLEKLRQAKVSMDAAKERGGIGSYFTRAGCALSMSVTFVRLYCHPVEKNELPEQVRLAASW